MLARLRADLEDDGPDGERERFLSEASPCGLVIAEGGRWEVVLEPETYEGHVVTMLMDGFECAGFRLDG